MSIDRTIFRTGVGIVSGVALGLLAPMLPAVGASSPPAGCTQLVGAASRVTDVRNVIVGRASLPVGVDSRLTSAQSQLAAAASQVCTPR